MFPLKNFKAYIACFAVKWIFQQIAAAVSDISLIQKIKYLGIFLKFCLLIHQIGIFNYKK